ncbi:uncharacterized protein CTRU02_215805 [Colletotrichum truncatum]|uniref:Uncharacterized protein n=1 Tax=Colletotrichum truncatum TaxID=5467 RepID=A0ACC3YBQ7_COLTU
MMIGLAMVFLLSEKGNFDADLNAPPQTVNFDPQWYRGTATVLNLQRSQLKPTKSDVDSYSTQHYFHDYITIVNMEKNLAENLKFLLPLKTFSKCKKMERKRISNTPTRLTQSDYNVVIQDTDPLAVNNDISTTETVVQSENYDF